MLNSLGQILSIFPRQAEATDARLGIKRHDPEEERRKNKNRPGAEDFEEEESPVLSVAALRIFLESLLAKHKSDFSEAAEIKVESEIFQNASSLPPERSSGRAVYASRAYSHAAETSAAAQTGMSSQMKDNGMSAAHLSAEDSKIARELLQNLKILEESGIENLPIKQGPDFIESLKRAVQSAKERIHH